MITGYYVPVIGEARTVQIKNELSAFRELIGCECVDMTMIGYSMIAVVDDCGLLTENPQLTVYDAINGKKLVGNVLITGCEWTSDGFDNCDLDEYQQDRLERMTATDENHRNLVLII